MTTLLSQRILSGDHTFQLVSRVNLSVSANMLIGLETSLKKGGSGWESNPPWNATQPNTGFEDREAHRDSSIPRLSIPQPYQKSKGGESGKCGRVLGDH